MNTVATQRLRLFVLISSAFVAAALTGLLLTEGDNGTRIATVLVLPATLVVLLISGVGWVRGRTATEEELRAAAEEIIYDLNQALIDNRDLVLANGSSEPIDVSFDVIRNDNQVWTTLSSVKLFELYKQQDGSQLYIQGDGGTGKTLLAIEFAVQLIKNQHDSPPAKLTIPLMLSLSALDLDPDINVTPTQLRNRLLKWIISELRATTNQPEHVARALVRRGYVMPIFDGLDEMDAENSSFINANATLEAISQASATGRTPAVVICRTQRFQSLLAAKPTIASTITNELVIRTRTLSRQDVMAYLTLQAERLGQPDKWTEVITMIRDRPDSPISTLLSRPLDLYLLMSSTTQIDSTSLGSSSIMNLRTDLLHNLVPAAVLRGAPEEDYQPAEVHTWLTIMAKHLSDQASRGGSETDIEISTLWVIWGTRLPRIVSSAATLLFGALLLLAPFGWARYSRGQWLPENNRQWFIDSTGCALVLLAAARASTDTHRVVRLDITALTRRSGRAQLFRYFKAFFIAGLVSGTFFFFLFGLAFAISFCVALSAALTALFGFIRAPALVASPRSYIRNAALADLMVLSECSLMYGIANGLANGLLHKAFGGLIFGLVYGCLLSAVLRSTSPWLRYLIVVNVFAAKGWLARRPGRFFEWGVENGLLRLSGVRIQFRHSEIRDFYLNSAPGPVITVPKKQRSRPARDGGERI